MKTLLRFFKVSPAFIAFIQLLLTSFCFSYAWASGNGGHKHAAANKGNSKPIITAPTVSYHTPNTYYAGTSVSLTPTSSGVAAPAFNATPVSIYTGNEPYGVAGDQAGNVYMAATFNGSVLKIPVGSGTPTTVGSGFSFPIDVAVDIPGNVYVADAGNNAIKKVTPGGTVSTLVSGLSGPTGVAADAFGNVFFIDGENALKEYVASTASVKLLANNLSNAYMVALDGQGNAYVTVVSTGTVLKITSNGTQTTFATGLSGPEGIAVDGAGNVYVSNESGASVSEIPAGGGTPVTLGSGFSGPIGLAIDGFGNVIVGDGGHDAVKKIEPTGGYYISPLLPQGLTFNESTGVIGGVAAINSPATNYTVTAYNSSGGTSTTAGIQTIILNINYPSPNTFTAGTAVTVTPTETNVASLQYNNAVAATGTAFTTPGQLATDAAGDVYIAVAGNNAIEKLTPDGVVTAIGSGFSAPTGVAVDALNNVWVADKGNNAIKKIPGGSGTPVTVVSGLSGPISVAVDGAGNAYFLESGRTVYLIPAGTTSYRALSSYFDNPVALTSDNLGNVYVADAGVSEIVKIPMAGGLPVFVASASSPTGVAVDVSGNIYYSGHGNNSIYILTAGSTTPVLVSGAFSNPVGVAADALGNVYGVDATSGSLQKIVPAGGYFINNLLPTGLVFNSANGGITGTPAGAAAAASYTVNAYNGYGSGASAFAVTSNLPALPTVSYTSPKKFIINTAGSLAPGGSGVAAPGYSTSTTTLGSGFYQPQAVAVDAAENIYVADYGNNSLKKIPAGGGTPTVLTGAYTVEGVAVDAAGNVYYSSFNNAAVYELVGGTGSPVTLISSGLAGPCGLATDAAGNLYIADFNANAIYKYPAGGGSLVAMGSGFTHPNDVAVDAAGNIYVADTFNNAIKEIPVGGGAVVTISTAFLDPYGVDVDGAGNIFVADRNASAVYEIPQGTTTPKAIGSGFYFNYGVAVGGSGKVYVADFDNNAVKMIKPTGGYYLSKGLPAGLSFSSSNGHISGTPTAFSQATAYTVTGYNPAGAANTSVTLSVVSTDATLSGLTLITGTLSPAFSPTTTSYTCTVSSTTTTISVHPTANTTISSLTVDGYNVPSGTVSDGIQLNVGPNTITIVVTAEDGVTTKTYTITVTRQPSNAMLKSLSLTAPYAALTTVSGPDYKDYTASVAGSVTSIEALASTADANATFTVNGNAGVSGAASAPIPLVAGPNTIKIVVTGQDGVTTETYVITVTRAVGNATLKSLSLTAPYAALTTVTGPDFRDYTASVPNTAASIEVVPTTTDASATLTINGNAATSGSASSPISLAVGANVIKIVVTASDGVTKDTYVITVTRAKSSNALLSALSLTSPNTNLTTVTGPDYKDYTASVPNTAASIKVLATAADPNATVTVNGTTVTSGTASAAIPLVVGPNPITVVCTAQDGVTKKNYVITVTRAKSSNDNLSSIALTSPYAALTTVTGPDFRDYTASVANTVASIKVLATTADPTATITVNGTAATSGTASGAVALVVGANKITTVCTAQDGVTTHSYVITVTRAGPVASLDQVSVTQPTETLSLADDGITVHKGVSPNGDGIEDILQIDNIAQYPDNHLTIMNRNGQLVYEATGYDNSTKAFDGHSNKTGQMQLPGTYFFSLDYMVNGITKHKTGFLVLKY